MAGILSYGGYIPRLRLQRAVVAQAHHWFNPSLAKLARGERAMANWDEDSVTLGLEAARDCLTGLDRGRVARVVLASTTHPFADRQNAGIVKEALGLSDRVGTLDVSGSQRAGTSALLDALQSVRGGAGDILCVAAEKHVALPGSGAELTTGDAAAAILVGEGYTVADFVAGESISVDFVDHYRAAGQSMDYGWEARWVRDQGYAQIGVEAVKGALEKAGLAPVDIDHFVMPAPMHGVNDLVAKACGIPTDSVRPTLMDQLGDAGAAQPILLLAHALEAANAGDLILVVGFGQGCDVLIFRANGEPARPDRLGISGWLNRRRPEPNYFKYLAFAGHLPLDLGMRAEYHQKTALTALYRNRRTVLGLIGGHCGETGVVQYPRTPVGVAQNAKKRHAQEDIALSDRAARILTFTADRLAFTLDPPLYYGTILFNEGGRMTVEFADVDEGQVAVDAPMRMMFRIKVPDGPDRFRAYFWKAVPDFRDNASEPLAPEKR